MPINAGDTTAEVKATIDQIIEDAGLDPADNTDTTAATSMLNEIAVLYDLPGLTGRMGGAAAREVINNLEEGGGVPFLTTPGTLRNSFATKDNIQVVGTGMTLAGNTAINTDPQFIKEGAASLAFTTGANAGETYQIRWTPPVQWLDPLGRLGVWVYVSDYTKITAIGLDVRVNPTTARTFTHSLTGDDKKYNGWHWVSAAKDQFGGTIDWDTQEVNRVGIQVIPATAEAVTVYVNALYSGFKARTQFLIVADDGHAEHATILAPMAEALGLRINVAVTGALIDSHIDWMTSAQLVDLDSRGHEVLPHGNVALTGVSLADARTLTLANRDFIGNLGLTKGLKSFVYPNGATNVEIIDMLEEEGFNIARGTVSPLTKNHAFGLDAGRMTLPHIGLSASDSAATIISRIDSDVARGDTAILMLHGIVASGATVNQVNTPVLQEILEHVADLKNAGQLRNPLMSELALH